MDSRDYILCERRTYFEKPHNHVHPYAQLIIPINGFLNISTDQIDFKMSSNCNDVVFVPPESYHSFHADEPNQFFVFDIPVTFLPDSDSKKPGSFKMNHQWQAIRMLLESEIGEQASSNQRIADLFRYILRLFETRSALESLDYIKANYHRSISISELARLEHYNPTYYCEWFQKKTGVSPTAYIRKLRINQAKRLLTETDFPIIQIAQQVGYRHQSTLTRAFLEDTGLLPSGYRLKFRKPIKNNL